MIQRIQSIYLFIAILCIGSVTFGKTIFTFFKDKMTFEISSFGIKSNPVIEGQIDYNISFPGYLIGLGLLIIGVATLFSFKNLQRQYRFGRLFFYTYFCVVLSVILLYYFGNSKITDGITSKHLNTGYFLLVAGFPFTFLANTGINRDKKMLDSLNRLR